VEKRGARRAALVGEDSDKREPTVIVDRDVDVLPADPPGAPSAITMDAMPDPVDPAQRLDVEVEQVTRPGHS
jgi:hypothetical protein